MDIKKIKNELLQNIDNVGKSISLEDWIELLGCLISDLEIRQEAAETDKENE